MTHRFAGGPRPWSAKVRDALRGVKRGVRGESSFFVHFFAAAVVLAAAAALGVSRTEWMLLVLCIASVLVAEMFNTALERMAKAVDDQHNPHLRDALDIGSAAVLITSIAAAIVGVIIFGSRLYALWL